MVSKLDNFTDFFDFDDFDEIDDSQSQPISLSPIDECSGSKNSESVHTIIQNVKRPEKGTGQVKEFRSVDEIDAKYRNVFSYPFFNLVQSRVMEDALYSDKSMVVCAPTGSGKTVVFEMAIVQLLMQMEDRNESHDFKIIYMAPVKALCTERLSEWYPKFTRLGLLCIEVTGDTDVDFSQLKPYRIIITTPEKWDMLTRRWRDHRQMVELIKLFLIDEVHILNDACRGPVLEAVVSRMKTIETSVQSTHRIEQLQKQYQSTTPSLSGVRNVSPSIRFVAVSATVGNPEDVAAWLGTADKQAVYYKFGDECRPVKLKRVVEGYSCSEGTSIFKFDLVLNYKLWPIIQKYHNGKPTLIFCNTRKSVALTAETLSREITITFNEAQKSRLMALASTIKNKKLQMLVLSGVGCHHAGLLYEERTNIEHAFRNRDLPILITTTTLAMGVNLPAHLVIIKNTQQYVNGAYQEYSISTILQMVGRAGRPQFDTEATAVIMTRFADKHRYQALVGGSEPLQSYLHKRLPENLNSEAALGTVSDVAQCVQWLRSTFLSVRAAKDPKRYLGLQPSAPQHQISKKIEELCVKAMNSLASTGLITMDEACCIESTEAGRLMSIYYLDLETMKHIMKIEGSESLEKLLWVVCESHELSDMHLRIDERRCLNALNRNNAAPTIRYPMKGKITTRQMKLNCVIQAILGCLPIPDPSLNQEATKIMRIADRVCKCLIAYVTRPAIANEHPKFYSAVLNTITLAKCVSAHLWENSSYVSKQLKGIGPTFSTLLAAAGKSNFMLLEESHPRDLERIMNKGPPAGNVLRKQISLFPKYQLTVTPIDEKDVSIQLALLNGHNLIENMDDLTAGACHKCYVIIGDSENVLLHLSSFVDKDLLSVYDGSITLKITRKYGFEHKIYAHCVSASIAGLDVRCEYVFKNLKPYLGNDEEPLKTPTRQTVITDTFRERKRKNTDNVTQSKEKKKRESVLIEKLKNLKEAFSKTSKVLKNDLNKSAATSQLIIHDLTNIEKPEPPKIAFIVNDAIVTNDNNKQLPIKSTFYEEPTTINDDEFDYIDDDNINNILNEIECEISKGSSMLQVHNKCNNATNDDFVLKASSSVNVTNCVSSSTNLYPHIDNYKAMQKKRMNKNIPKRSNYDFIDLLENNVDLSDADDPTVKKTNGFSDTIRSHVEKYLQSAKTDVQPVDIILTDLIQDEVVTQTAEEPMVMVRNFEKTIQSECLYDEQQCHITDISKVDDICLINQVTVLEKKIKSIDLTANDSSLINIKNRVEKYEIELPAVNLNKKSTKVTEYKIENRGCSNVNNKVQDSQTHSKKCINPENSKAMDLLESINTELAINRSAEEFKNPLEEDNAYPFQNFDRMSNAVQKHEMIESPRIVEPRNYFIEPQDIKECKHLTNNEERQINFNQMEKTTRELIEFNNPAPGLFDTLGTTTQHNRDTKLIALPNILSFEFDRSDEAINKCILSEISEINDEDVIRNNKMKQISYGIGAASKQLHQNKSDLPQTTMDVSKFIENPKSSAIELWRNYNKPFTAKSHASIIPPFKSQYIRAFESLTATKICNEPSVIKSKNIPDVKENQGTLALTTSTNHSPETNHTQTLISLEPIKMLKGVEEIKAYSIANHSFNSQQIRDKQSNSSNMPFVNKNTVNRLPALQVLAKRELPEIILRKKPRNFMNCDINTHSSFKNANSNANISCLDGLQVIPDDDANKDLEIREIGPKRDANEIKNVETYNHFKISDLDRSDFSTENYNHSNSDTQDSYVNKYSYSTNKVDVTTNEVNDHVVRVIRKMRVDLDITEIVSKEKKTPDGNAKEKCYSQTPGAVFKRRRLESDIECDNKNTKQCYITCKNNDEDTLLRNNTPNVLMINENLTKDKTFKSILIPEPPTQVSTTNSKQYVTIEKSLSNETDYDKSTSMFSKFEIESVPKEAEPVNVASILQKYSNIIRNNTETADININQFKKPLLRVTEISKPKKPFKISEINRLNSPLTGVLIDVPKPVNVTQCLNLSEPDNKLNQTEHNKQQNICDLIVSTKLPLYELEEHSTATENIHDRIMQNRTMIEELRMPECNIPLAHIERFAVKDAVPSINQNMLNPKTLLECFSNDEPEDLISPPAGYCDDFNHTDCNSVESFMDCYEPTTCEESSREENNYSISNDSQVELSPYKEIETWSLSQDEGGCVSFASSVPSPFSYTIMRKNNLHQNTLKSDSVPNYYLPRRNKLNQFKFNQKSKLKARR